MVIAYIFLGVYMPRRTTIILDDDVYKMLVEESIRRYGTARAISKVLNEIVRKSFRNYGEFMNLVYSDKYVEISGEEFERFRRELSKKIEER